MLTNWHMWRLVRKIDPSLCPQHNREFILKRNTCAVNFLSENQHDHSTPTKSQEITKISINPTDQSNFILHESRPTLDLRSQSPQQLPVPVTSQGKSIITSRSSCRPHASLHTSGPYRPITTPNNNTPPKHLPDNSTSRFSVARLISALFWPQRHERAKKGGKG
ncbi:hypothetical protein DL98DRAFT_270019 [Cadophora sp. DSE1049]|nr:hypothetical protein DL98DRAFT_270019 [Cadophora sp. DSE1049]